MDAPLLSFCLSGRNDDYCGNFIYRMETALNYLARNAGELGALDRVEIVVADWNSDPRLSDVLRLSPEAAASSRFIHVPPDIAQPLNAPGGFFNSSCSQNVALRRARGDYLLYMPADILHPRTALGTLIDLLTGRLHVPFDVTHSLMTVRRKFVPWQLVEQEPDIDRLDRFLFHSCGLLTEGDPFPGANANMGSFLMHRALWHECRGMDERLRAWGWSDIELGLRVNLRHPCVDLSSVGVFCYELDSRPDRRDTDVRKAGVNPHNLINTSFAANDAGWGLGDLGLQEYRCTPLPTSGPRAEGRVSRQEITREGFVQYLTDKHLVEQVQGAFGKEFTGDEDWPALYLLAAYTMRYRPRTYLEFGFGKGLSAILVAACHPCIDIFGINDWQGDRFFAYPHNVSENLSKIARYKGHLRYVTGGMESALQRLQASTEGLPGLDMLLVRADLVPNTCLKHFDEVLSLMSDGGLMVITARDPDLFRQVDRAMLQNHPRKIYLASRRFRTGFLLHKKAEGPLPSPELQTHLEMAMERTWKSFAVQDSRNKPGPVGI